MSRIQLTREEIARLHRQAVIAAKAMEEIFEVLRHIGDRTGKEWDPEGTEDSVAGILDQFSSWHLEEITAEAVVERFGAVGSWAAVIPEKTEVQLSLPTTPILF